MPYLQERGFVLDGLDAEGWLFTRGVEYFPLAALHDVMKLVGEWFTDRPGLSSRQVVVEVDDVYDVVEAPALHDVVGVDVDSAVIFDSDVEQLRMLATPDNRPPALRRRERTA